MIGSTAGSDAPRSRPDARMHVAGLLNRLDRDRQPELPPSALQPSVHGTVTERVFAWTYCGPSRLRQRQAAHLARKLEMADTPGSRITARTASTLTAFMAHASASLSHATR